MSARVLATRVRLPTHAGVDDLPAEVEQHLPRARASHGADFTPTPLCPFPISRSGAADELRALFRAAAPIIVANTLNNLFSLVDFAFVGQWVGPTGLAAAAIANSFFNMVAVLLVGAAEAVDRACERIKSHGALGATGDEAAAPAAAGSDAGPSPQGGLEAVAAAAAASAATLESPRFQARLQAAYQKLVAGSASVAGRTGFLAQRGVFVSTAMALPAVVALSLAGYVLGDLLQQPRPLALAAASFCDSLIIGLLPLAAVLPLSKWLCACDLVKPTLAIAALANLLNVAANALLVDVNGFVGAPLATSVCRVLQLALTLGYIWRRVWRRDAPAVAQAQQPAPTAGGGDADTAAEPRPGAGGASAVEGARLLGTGEDAAAGTGSRGEDADVDGGGGARASVRRAVVAACCSDSAYLAIGDTRALARMGASAVLCTCLFVAEAWPYELATLVAGRTGDVQGLCAHTALQCLSTLLLLGVPTGIAAAGRDRLAGALRGGRPHDAFRTIIVAASASVVYALACAVVSLTVRGSLGRVFLGSSGGGGGGGGADDEEAAGVGRRIADLATVAAVYQTIDGAQSTLGWMLRGVSRRLDAAVGAVNAASWWLGGLPVAAVLALPPDTVVAGVTLTYGRGMGVEGVWWGMVAAAGANALAFGWMLQTVDWVAASRAARSSPGPGNAQ